MSGFVNTRVSASRKRRMAAQRIKNAWETFSKVVHDQLPACVDIELQNSPAQWRINDYDTQMRSAASDLLDELLAL